MVEARLAVRIHRPSKRQQHRQEHDGSHDQPDDHTPTAACWAGGNDVIAVEHENVLLAFGVVAGSLNARLCELFPARTSAGVAAADRPRTQGTFGTIRVKCSLPCNPGGVVALDARTRRAGMMDNSVYQARWMLGPLLGLCVSVALVGMVLG
jgi:hypothetical protein